MPTFPVLTVHQPWATFIIEGYKLWEFREPNYGTLLANKTMGVHAAKRPMRRGELLGLLYNLQKGGDDARRTGFDATCWDTCIPLLERWVNGAVLPMSTILGLIDVGVPVRNQDLADRLGVPHVHDPVHEHSNWGMPLSNPRRFGLGYPISGQRGVWYFSINDANLATQMTEP